MPRQGGPRHCLMQDTTTHREGGKTVRAKQIGFLLLPFPATPFSPPSLGVLQKCDGGYSGSFSPENPFGFRLRGLDITYSCAPCLVFFFMHKEKKAVCTSTRSKCLHVTSRPGSINVFKPPLPENLASDLFLFCFLLHLTLAIHVKKGYFPRSSSAAVSETRPEMSTKILISKKQKQQDTNLPTKVLP